MKNIPPLSCCFDVLCALKVSEILYEGITGLKGLEVCHHGRNSRRKQKREP
jgi:hypothetical protein